MKTWQEDLLNITDVAKSEREVFARVEVAAASLGFDYVAYGFRAPIPLSNPRTVLLSNYPQAWCERYAQAGYLGVDPTVLHGRRCQSPLIWSDSTFEAAATMWREAQSFGLKVGWAQSSLDGHGVGGMLTLSRSNQALDAAELATNERKMCWLVHVSHMALARHLKTEPSAKSSHCLTFRELEVLKWTGDGKSAQDIADILTLSKNTVDFHVKNAVNKLCVSNKTAAVVRAAMLGYLN